MSIIEQISVQFAFYIYLILKNVVIFLKSFWIRKRSMESHASHLTSQTSLKKWRMKTPTFQMNDILNPPKALLSCYHCFHRKSLGIPMWVLWITYPKGFWGQGIFQKNIQRKQPFKLTLIQKICSQCWNLRRWEKEDLVISISGRDPIP